MFCPHCGKEISEGQAFCQHCGSQISEAAPVLAAPVAGMREKTPWEDREHAGFLRRVVQNAETGPVLAW